MPLSALPPIAACAAAACSLLLTTAALAQNPTPPANKTQGAPPEAYLPGDPLPYFGTEDPWNRRAFARPHNPNEGARIGQAIILDLEEGRTEDAINSAREWMTKDPAMGESRFGLILALAKLGRLGEAEREMNTLLDGGFPPERFLAGPRHLVAPLRNLETFKRRIVGVTRGLVHGPMLGAIRPDRVKVWVRTENESTVEVRIVDGRDFGKSIATAKGRTEAKEDFTGVVELAGLKPGTFYSYRVLIDGVEVPRWSEWTFRTPPADSNEARVSLAFGACAQYTPAYETIWDTIRLRQPDAFLTLGDNVYIDLPGQVNGLHDYTYYCRQSRPEWRRLTGSTPVYSIWDDHDCVIDDVFMGPYVDKPAWKQGHFRVFRRNWNNPMYGDEPRKPGAWHKFRMGPVEVFMIDGRFYRENWRREGASMLGPEQKRWLLDSLRASTATFKVLASPVPWADDAKTAEAGGDAYDTWVGHRAERTEIFELLKNESINGVILISGDRHRTDVRMVKHPGLYPMFEIESGRLTNSNFHPPHGKALFVYTAAQTFSVLKFDGTPTAPVATLEIVNIKGETVWQREVPLSEISVK